MIGNIVKLTSSLFILLASTGCQDSVDTQDVESMTEPKEAEKEKVEAEATVIMDGEALPIRRVSCKVLERGQNIMIAFDLEPRQYVDLFIVSNPSYDKLSPKVTLRLPTELKDESGFDLWKSEGEEALPMTETGVNGTFEIEGEDIGYGLREPAMLEVNVTCPSW